MTLMMRQMSRRIKMHRINDIGNKFCKSFLKLLPDSLPKLCSHAELRTSARTFLFLMTKRTSITIKHTHLPGMPTLQACFMGAILT